MKKKSGAFSVIAPESWLAEIGVDQREADEQRQPEPEREHDARRQRAGPVDVADGKPQRRAAHAVEARARPS